MFVHSRGAFAPRLRRLAAPCGRAVLVAIAGLAVGAADAVVAGAQEPAAGAGLRSGVVTGLVRDSAGTVVAGAEVGIVGALGRGTTGSDGSFRMAAVPVGRQTIVVRRLGFRPDSAVVQVAGGDTARVSLTLAAMAYRIAPVVVEAGRPRYTGRMAGFNERRDRGMGHYFTAEDIDRRNPMRVSDLLRTVPGLRVIPQRNGENLITLRNQRCTPFIWLDGAPATAGFLNPDYFSPNTLAGIEVYAGPATVPSELMGVRGRGGCGVIALWSRMPEPTGRRSKRTVTAQELSNLVASLRLYTADQVDVPAAADTSEGPIVPVYPDSLLRAGIAGRVLVEFVVDTGGSADMDTFSAVTSTHPRFTDAVRRAVQEASFTPAMREGRRVRQLMHYPFEFVVPPGTEGSRRGRDR